MRRRLATWILIGTTILIGWSGCGEDDPVGPTAEDPGPESAAALMQDFLAVYENLDFVDYLPLLADDFRCYLLPSVVDDNLLPTDHLDHDAQQAISERIFSGTTYVSGSGSIVPGTTSISFNTFLQEAQWDDAPLDGPFVGCQWAPFRLDVVVTQGPLVLRIQGLLDFYVRAEQVAGGSRVEYRLVGQIDHTGSGAKPVEEASWSNWQVLYR